MKRPRLSALIRCRDEERGIGALVDALRAQTIGEWIELIVIDSGSRDGTLDRLRERGIEPLRLPPERFSFGRALNLAAAAAGADLCAAISAHALPPDERWAERALAAMEDERVACASAERRAPDLSPLREPVTQDLGLARLHPFWGYTNSAGVFRRALWEARPFDERLRAGEDKEWAWHWLHRGYLVRLDPGLGARHSHADEGPLATYRRNRDCFRAHAAVQGVGAQGVGAVAREWWSGPHFHRSDARARLDPRRLAILAGKYVGLRTPGRARL